jgi:hypothetical protein
LATPGENGLLQLLPVFLKAGSELKYVQSIVASSYENVDGLSLSLGIRDEHFIRAG